MITGTSGAGKGTLVQELLRRVPEVALAVSATTRGRRPGEVDGVHYWFISDEEFDRRLAEDDFLEYYAFPWGQRSGTLWSELDRIRDQRKAPLLELEPNGAQSRWYSCAGPPDFLFLASPELMVNDARSQLENNKRLVRSFKTCQGTKARTLHHEKTCFTSHTR